MPPPPIMSGEGDMNDAKIMDRSHAVVVRAGWGDFVHRIPTCTETETDVSHSNCTLFKYFQEIDCVNSETPA